MSKILSYFNNPRRIFILILFIGVCVFVLFSIFPLNQEYINPIANEKVELETKTLVEKVAQLIYLPENEIPTIATVTDLSALKGQDFFIDAKVGDKVLIFTKAKKAILYNPKSNKIVTVAPLAIGDKENPLQY